MITRGNLESYLMANMDYEPARLSQLKNAVLETSMNYQDACNVRNEFLQDQARDATNKDFDNLMDLAGCYTYAEELGKPIDNTPIDKSPFCNTHLQHIHL